MEANFEVQPFPGAGLHERRAYEQRKQQPEREAPHEGDLQPEAAIGRSGTLSTDRRLFHRSGSIALITAAAAVSVVQLAWLAFLIVSAIWAVGLLL